MIVQSCKRCPFFQSTIVSLLAGGRGGVCAYDPVTDSLLIAPVTEPDRQVKDDVDRRRRISDPLQIPNWCPLRLKPVTVELRGDECSG